MRNSGNWIFVITTGAEGNAMFGVAVVRSRGAGGWDRNAARSR